MSSIGNLRALILEDEPSLQYALRLSLEKMGYQVTTLSTLEEAYSTLSADPGNFSLLLLDRNLPDGDSIELCTHLRNSGFGGLILMLTASGELADRVSGLHAGADDYLSKPFSWEELEARIRALQRRLSTAEGQSPANSSQHLWRLDTKTRAVLTPKGWKKLTAFEFKLLSHLIHSRGKPVSKEQLLQQVWGLRILPRTRTVDWFIGRLRKAVEEDPKNPAHILNERGLGYFFRP